MLRIYKDHLNRQVEVPFPPLRIVSLVPSQTELLADLGLDQEVIGITKFCLHPESWFRNKTRIGGTKTLNLGKIQSLKPDLIIANKEENDQSQISELMAEFPTWISDVRSLQDALSMIHSVSEITNRAERGAILRSKIRLRFENIPATVMSRTCAYLIWWQPMMTVNSDTFIHDMLMYCGFKNVFGHRTDSRYPEISEEDLMDAKPDYILLSSEPFPFKEKHIQQLRQQFPHSQIRLVDGENFSWYGSRLLHFQTLE